MEKIGLVLMVMTVGAIIGGIITFKLNIKLILKYRKMSEKHLTLYKLMNQWMQQQQQGKLISNYLKSQGYNQVAIYGMHYIGERLYHELKQSGIEVMYGIDINGCSGKTEIPIKNPEEQLEPVDIIIVTAITYFDEIREKLSKKIDCPVVSILNIINKC